MVRKIFKAKVLNAPVRKHFHISTLPAELLAMIFILTIPWGKHHRTTRKLGPYPLSLIYVCKSWKDIALRTPELWASVVLSSHRAQPSQVGAGVKQWFSRAKDKPLSFVTNLKPGGFLRTGLESSVPWGRLVALEISNDSMLSLDLARSVLMRCINIQTCTLKGIDGWSKRKKAMPCTEPVRLRYLRSLTIEFESSRSPPYTDGHTEIHWLFLPLVLPRLEKLDIRATQSSADESLMPALLAAHARSRFSLTHLHLGRIAFDCADLCKLLRVSPRIRHLYLEGTPTPQSFAPLLGNLMTKNSKRAYVLPKLEELVIIDSSPDAVWPSWDAISLKFLESRSWRGGRPPFGDPGLVRLRDVAIIWKSTSSFPSHRNFVGAQQANKLREDGLLLFYPTLDLPRQKGSKLNVDFWWM